MGVLKTEFSGDRSDLFQLALKTGVLTVLTFGLYRFWQTTRVRRWYWSSVRPGNSPMEYTGSPLEMLMGFFFAVIVLAIYLTIFNVGYMFGLTQLMQVSPEALFYGFIATPVALIPLYFVAQYRSRRYLLARTRWRGIRMAMEPGAWGYAWRACMYWTLTIMTLGLLWPLMTFQLEKYLTDRTWFGNARFTQFGHFGRLYGPIIPFLLGVYGTIALVVYAVMSNELTFFWYVPMTVILAGLGAAYYRVSTTRLMAGLKLLGDGLEFDIHPSTRKLLRIQIMGNLLSGFLVSLVSPVILGLVLGALFALGLITKETIFSMPVNLSIFVSAITSLFIFVLLGAFRQVFVTYPMVRHFAETLEIFEPSLLSGIRQRRADNGADGGGFAEALDVGAAF
jgi:uncharacterized membrane protein YjgN (DUF898 family)